MADHQMVGERVWRKRMSVEHLQQAGGIVTLNSMPLIVGLFFVGCPSHITRFIIPIVVNSI